MRRANIRAWAGLGRHIIDLNGLGPGWALSPWAWAGPGWGLLNPWRTLVWCLACVRLLILFVPYDITVLVVHHQIFLHIPGREFPTLYQLLCRRNHIVKIITEAW